MAPGLGEILAETGDITLRRLQRASGWQRVHGGTIDRALLATGAVSEETLLDALTRLTGLPSVSRERLAASPRDVVETLPADARRRLRALPFDRRGDVLQVAVVDPGNPVLETGLIASTGCDVRLFVTAEPILDDVLRNWEPAAAVTPTAATAPAPPPAGREAGTDAAPLEPVVDPDPFGRLARALLVDVIDEGAQAVEIGREGAGAVVRTFSGGAVLTSRPLPVSVLEPLLAWLVSRGRPAGPFDAGGIVLEKARRRVRVTVSGSASDTAWLVLEPEDAPAPRPAEVEICLHEAADGEVFCPACGVAL